MSRIAVIVALLLTLPVPAANSAKESLCGKRVQAFNEYEELKDGKIIEKVSVFDLPEWSPDSGFQGLVVKSGEKADTKIELEVLRQGEKQTVKAESKLGNWTARKDFLAPEKLDAKSVFGSKYVAGTYVVRLKLAGKTLCEETRKMAPGH